MMPIFETNETPEQQLIRTLREKGFESPESLKLLLDWTMEQEKMVEQSRDYVGAQIQLNIKRACLYRDAGNLDAARESLEDAAEHAWNEHRDELYEEVVKEIQQMQDSNVK